jgi:microcystin-dependent protein
VASTYTPNLALEIPAFGDYATTGWSSPMDNSLNQLDTGYGGFLSLSCTGGSLSLTVAQASNPVIEVYGTLSSDQYISFPPIAGRRVIIQGINLNGFTLYVRGNNFNDPTGIYFFTSFGIPYPIIVTPSRVYWDYGPVGPGTIAEMPTTFIHNGWLPCDGRYVSQTQHDLLYDISGAYFALPDYRGSVTAMADNIGAVPASGPYSVNEGSRGVLNGWGVVTFAGEANHQLQIAEMPGHNHPGSGDSGHAHGVYDPGHAHGGVVTGLSVPGPIAGGQGGNLAMGGTAAAGTGIGIEVGYANIVVAAQGGWAAHNNVQPTTCTMKMIRW